MTVFGWFHDAVDPVTLGVPDYFDVVKTPNASRAY